ncbi:NADPH-dependent FMN reductase [Rhodoligotrophos defluvii]|uniref:NADPH-dependent FMN reductase n=1 Tax=Rhodoligotrophos defluvii TaxID=2561934 RepID=UPI001484FD91|nr:NAD(P)H-dependent oxidoreductase [Rhodoligotrophos defluvii]
MNIVLIYGTAAPAGRLAKAMRAVTERIWPADGAHATVIDLAEISLPFAGATPWDRLSDQVREAIETVVAANAVIIFSPVYRASAPGSLKNFLDLLPVEAFEAKPVAIVAMGATHHHFLAVEADLHPILSWFGAILLPSLYLSSASFEQGELTGNTADDLAAYTSSVLDAARRLHGLRFMPRPLAAAKP